MHRDGRFSQRYSHLLPIKVLYMIYIFIYAQCGVFQLTHTITTLLVIVITMIVMCAMYVNVMTKSSMLTVLV